MQGNPDPYSAFSQGLTGGVNTGMNIMQMIQQKAQAARQNSLSSFASGAAIMKDPDLAAMHENAYEMMKNSWSELNPKSEFPSKESFGDKGRAKRLDGIMKIEDPKMQYEALNAELAMAPKGTQEQFKPYLEFKEKQAATQERERKISGTPSTPGLAAPSPGYNPNAVDAPNTMYGLTGNVPGTQGQPGLRSMMGKYTPLETESMLAEYEQTGKFNVPKDEKGKEYKEYMYQDTKTGEYRKGLFDGITMVKDLGKATEKDVKYKPEDVEDAELKTRLKIKQLVYGGMGAKYDPISQAWAYPPNFDYNKAQRAEATYLKKRGMVPITGELPFKGDESKHVPLQKKMKALDEATAAAILSEVGGDKDKARQIAKERGYQF